MLIILALLGFGFSIYLSFHASTVAGSIEEKLAIGLMVSTMLGFSMVISSSHYYWGLLLEGLSIASLLYMVSENKKAQAKEEEARIQREAAWREERDKAIGGTALDRFYVECVLARCADFSVPTNAERAKLLAQKHGQYPPCTTEELFLEARAKHGTIGDTLRKERLAKLKEQEYRAYHKSIEYANYHGKEKIRVMLTHKIQELRREESLLLKGAATAASLPLEKERDWAVWGGIADGLAGPGAGVAVAWDVQTQNAQIRERNNVMGQAAAGYYIQNTAKAEKVREAADSEERRLNSLPEKLLDDKASPQEVFQQMVIDNDKVEVSETGACRVTALIKAVDNPKIYGDVNARIDGYIWAHIYEDEECVGTAKMVLPIDGISSWRERIMGICLNGAHPEKKQSVRFEAGDLWLIEK